MGLFSIHRRLPAFQPSLLALFGHGDLSLYRNRNGSGQPNPTVVHIPPCMALCHKPTSSQASRSPHPFAAPAVIKPFPARALSTTPTALGASLFWASRLDDSDRRACSNDSNLWHVGQLRWPRNRSAVLDTEGQRWAEGEVGFRVNSPLFRYLGMIHQVAALPQSHPGTGRNRAFQRGQYSLALLPAAR